MATPKVATPKVATPKEAEPLQNSAHDTATSNPFKADKIDDVDDKIVVDEVNTFSNSFKHGIKHGGFLGLTYCVFILAVGVSVYNISARHRLKNTQEFRKGIRDDISAMDETVVVLSNDLNHIKTNLTDKLNDFKTSVDTFVRDLINVQSDISGVKSDVQELRGNLGDVQDSMAKEKTKVWGKIAKLEEETFYLAQNGGNSLLSINRSLTICIVLFFVI